MVRLGRWVMYRITPPGHEGSSMAQGILGGYGARTNSLGGFKFPVIVDFETCWSGIGPIARHETSSMSRKDSRKVLPDLP